MSERQMLRVWPEWASSGIWEIKVPMQQSAGVNISHAALNLPPDLAARFDAWIERSSRPDRADG